MDITTAQANLAAATAAYTRALEAKSYMFQTANGMRSVTNHDVDKLRDEMVYWQNIVNSLLGRGKCKYSLANFSDA